MALQSAKQFHGFTMQTLDGNAGTVKETLFDEAAWVIRYLVVETGGWLDNNEILIASLSVMRLDWDRKIVCVDLTSEQIKESPGIGITRPMLRANEAEFLDHYGYSHYWNGLSPSLPAVSPETAPAASAGVTTRREAIERDLAQVASDLQAASKSSAARSAPATIPTVRSKICNSMTQAGTSRFSSSIRTTGRLTAACWCHRRASSRSTGKKRRWR